MFLPSPKSKTFYFLFSLNCSFSSDYKPLPPFPLQTNPFVLYRDIVGVCLHGFRKWLLFLSSSQYHMRHFLKIVSILPRWGSWKKSLEKHATLPPPMFIVAGASHFMLGTLWYFVKQELKIPAGLSSCFWFR